ncbi:neutral/alkaline non-lysosomal ceramidase N-terminal domain-containing protein [Parendozoicomonas sp. Alg238-R29]|uniref:neutral/alkaline non-lysosomal ceramidase N-terminal domain-containing protein n=1 Tax=Parendozoicomonas sp. Alg238-R29 TaxID=2993446 RepID=UPI00248E4C9E|nr:neutral/alkaline non-lysosomal ceramidase N-terminal domain-containing protein [Parendozoicomonas sp. Alg238-R29]
MIKRGFAVFTFALLSTFVAKIQASWLVGVGKSDITGPAVDIGLLGYGESSQVARGIHDRMWARAFVVAEPVTQKRVVIVVLNAAMVFGDVTREVIRRLQLQFGPLYQDGNMLILADHSHSANGGQGGHLLFSLAVHGFFPDAFEAMVSGIVDSIVQAHKSLAPGRVLINQGELYNASANRSLKAFLRNPESATMKSIDPEMVVMKFERDTKPVGMLGWFATHGVSFPKNNLLISGDNKGYAAALMEKEMGNGFVAAFPQTNAGDMTPNVFIDGTGPGSTPEESARIIGRMQFQKGQQLLHEATREITGAIEWQHEYVDFSQQTVSEQLTHLPRPVDTCPATAGYGFAAGTRDGRPQPWEFFFKEGYKEPYFPWTTISDFLTGLTPEIAECNYPKVSLLALGAPHDFHYINWAISHVLRWNVPLEISNYSWTPQVLPVSLVQLGDVGLLGVPAEFTRIAGHRLKKTVEAAAGERFKKLILAGYANDYSLYVATPEEYQEQLYEGGATLFGPWTLPAYQQVFSRLSENLIHPGSLPKSEAIPDNLNQYYQNVEVPPVTCAGYEEYGRLLSSTPQVAWTGQVVKACFTSTHPRLAVRRLDTFLTVEKLGENNQWHRIATDDDWDTRFYWYADYAGASSGEACVEWHIPYDTSNGVYRLGHQGIWRSPQGGTATYHGYSRGFAVVQESQRGTMLILTRKILSGR